MYKLITVKTLTLEKGSTMIQRTNPAQCPNNFFLSVEFDELLRS